MVSERVARFQGEVSDQDVPTTRGDFANQPVDIFFGFVFRDEHVFDEVWPGRRDYLNTGDSKRYGWQNTTAGINGKLSCFGNSRNVEMTTCGRR
jgi:hypothetical protein